MDTKAIEELIARMKAGNAERSEAITAINDNVPLIEAEMKRLKGLIAQLNSFKSYLLTYTDYFQRIRETRKG